MSSRCECVVKRTGKVCAKPTTGFNSQGTPVCGTHTGRPRKRRLVDTPPPTMLRRDPHRGIKQEYPPPPPPPQPTIMLRRDPHRGIKQELPTKQHQFFVSVLSWIVVLTTLMLLNPPPPQPTSSWTQKMLGSVFTN